MVFLRRLPAVVLLLAACAAPADRPAADTAAAAAPAGPPAAPRLPDSLALTAPDGAELWFTDARAATAADGTPCVERVMELRRDGARTPIPLLYTAERPRLLNDSTAEAHIYLNCVPGNLYRIHLRTGHPTYVGRAP